ncbi:MAG: DUF427 domain-containing protein [Chloroflexota bacterium]
MNKIKRIEPGTNQESVWDYPRPPRLERSLKHIRVEFNGVTIAETSRAYRVLETSHPPVYYIPLEDIKQEYLIPGAGQSFCEFKGEASYYTAKVGDKMAQNVGWFYKNPTAGFGVIKNYVAFYPARVDACYIDDEKVIPQAGNFYGGWITHEVVGPFKGEPGTSGW